MSIQPQGLTAPAAGTRCSSEVPAAVFAPASSLGLLFTPAVFGYPAGALA